MVIPHAYIILHIYTGKLNHQIMVLIGKRVDFTTGIPHPNSMEYGQAALFSDQRGHASQREQPYLPIHSHLQEKEAYCRVSHDKLLGFFKCGEHFCDRHKITICYVATWQQNKLSFYAILATH